MLRRNYVSLGGGSRLSTRDLDHFPIGWREIIEVGGKHQVESVSRTAA
jgi:hypothetical protein